MNAKLPVVSVCCCGAVVPVGDVEHCWYCGHDLCGACWEQSGHCGHSEADAINLAAQLGPG